MDGYRITPITYGTSDDIREKIPCNTGYPEEKGDDLTDQVTIAVEKIFDGSIANLRNNFRKKEQISASERNDHESDSDSDSEFSDRIRHLAEEDTTWFKGCGFKFTLDTSIFITQIMVGSIIAIFCMLKLWTTDDCSVMSTYAPLLSAIVMYFLSHMGSFRGKGNKEA